MSYRTVITRNLRRFEKRINTYNNIYISKSAILSNFDTFQDITNNDFLIPVLKANAYGHGLEQITTILKSRKIPYIAVDGYFEAIRVHNISKQPVLVMGAINKSDYMQIRTKRCAFVVSDEQSLNALASTKENIKIHLELETGMHRFGLSITELDKFLKALKTHANIELEGVMSHLADAGNSVSNKYTDRQVEIFDRAVEQIKSRGFSPKYLHIAQSAGSVKVKSKTANTSRIGLGLYGISPLAGDDKKQNVFKELKPALRLTSKIAKIVKLKKGDSVSYGCTFIAKKDTTIGVLPLGYYEGVPRVLSKKGVVKIGNNFRPIIGQICMNHLMFDVTGLGAKVGDEVIVFSNISADENSITSIATRHNLFNYELLTGLKPDVRRTVVD